MSMANCPLVRNARSGGSPMRRDRTGSPMCSPGIHCRNPINACPVPSRTYARCTVLIPFSTRPAQPICCRLIPAVASPFFCCPVSSSAPITSFGRRRPPLRAASSSPDTANRRIWVIASASSQHARFSIDTGIPVLDSLGPVGFDIHSTSERVDIDSLVQRAKLSALFLHKIATGQIALPPASMK